MKKIKFVFFLFVSMLRFMYFLVRKCVKRNKLNTKKFMFQEFYVKYKTLCSLFYKKKRQTNSHPQIFTSYILSFILRVYRMGRVIEGGGEMALPCPRGREGTLHSEIRM